MPLGYDPTPPSNTGATAATRYMGGTTSGPPTSGTFAVGDYVVSQDGNVWTCIAAGTPGSWTTPSNRAMGIAMAGNNFLS